MGCLVVAEAGLVLELESEAALPRLELRPVPVVGLGSVGVGLGR